jgi:hypothetical protein
MILQTDFPVFILAKDCGDIAKFNSLEEIQRELELIDVENGEYEAWDKNGLPLELKTQKPVWLKLQPSSSSVKLDQLKEAIISFGLRGGIDVSGEDLTALDCETLFQRLVADRKKTTLNKGFFRKIIGRQSTKD